MTHLQSNITESNCTYPGEYVPAPLTMDDIHTALTQTHEGSSMPLTNVVETRDAFTVEVAAPGLKNIDFLVSIHQNILSVSVLHKEINKSSKTYHQHEFNYCCFKREIELPDGIDADFLNAVYKRGILYVRLPKCKESLVSEVERVIVY